MTELAKSDLFFLITSVSVVLFTIAALVCFLYIFFILRKAKYIVDKIKEESEHIIEDIHDLRIKLKADSGAIRKVAAITTFFRSVVSTKKKRQNTKRKKKAHQENAKKETPADDV